MTGGSMKSEEETLQDGIDWCEMERFWMERRERDEPKTREEKRRRKRDCL